MPPAGMATAAMNPAGMASATPSPHAPSMHTPSMKTPGPAAAPSSATSSSAAPSSAAAMLAADDASRGELLHLRVDEISENPFQPRRDFSDSEIASLAESLKEHDLLQPVLVRRVNGRYQLISGERRLRAATRAGWKTIPARLREADDRLVAELAIIENLQRKDLNPVEKAMSFKRYVEQHRCTQDELAQRLKLDRSTIANLMRLLELPAQALDAIRNGLVTAGHARALLPLGDARAQVAFCERIVREELSVRDVERMVAEQIESEDSGRSPVAGKIQPAGKRPRSEQVASLEQELRAALGAKIEIRTAAKGRGKIMIHFNDHDDFERVFEQLVEGGTRATKIV
jgi:ParB family chromosome partitioning protein